jgi:hypothetical protein
MSDLLTSVIAAHGGLEGWRELRRGSATFLSSGELLDRKAPRKPTPRRITVALHEEFASVTPFGGPDQFSSFKPDRVAIETKDGRVLAERLDPRAAFTGHDLDTAWDPLHQAYFGGYAMWTYLNSPFMFSMRGVRTEEIAPIKEKGETWRGLRVTLPPHLTSHSTAQDFYFGDDFLLRRQDYTLDVAGGHNIANYALYVGEFNGLRIPTKRRAFLCTDRYRVLYDRLLMQIDISDIAFS